MTRFIEEVSNLSKPRLALLCVELQRELEARRQSKAEPIAIIGLGCRLPGGVDSPQAFWRLLEQGIDAVGPIPDSRWDLEAYYDPLRTVPGKMYTRSGGFLDRVEEFDPEFFGISPREARHMDPQHRLLLEVAWEALEHAGQPADQLHDSPTGVFVGIGTYDYATWQTMELSHASINAYTGTGNTFCFASGRLSYVLGLHGPSIALDAACATSLVTVHLACQSLRAGECSLALAGGVNLMLAPTPTIFLSQAQALSPDGRCKTFDVSADGYGRSEGCGIVVLKRLAEAVAAGDRVLAVIRGSATNHDGRSAGLTVPNGAAQQAVIREALSQAGVSPHEIDYVEAHGTGTALGDPIEVRALGAVLGGDARRTAPLWIGAVKTNIGHCEVAAGVTSLTKVVLALQHETIPRHLHYRETNPHIAFDEIPARVTQEPVPWPQSDRPRIAGVNAFGLSGTNAHLVVEEFRAPLEERDSDSDRDTDSNDESNNDSAPAGPHVLTLSARDSWSLGAMATRWEQALAPGGSLDLDGIALRDICYTAAARRMHHRHRWAAVVHSIEDARRKLTTLAEKLSTANAANVGMPSTRREHKVAFVFSGQGSPWWAMGRDLMAREPVFRHAIDECLRIFGALGDTHVAEVFQADESNSRINDTEVAQPALFAVQIALVRLLASWGVKPDAVIGHSVGEIAAAHVSGALTLEEAARMVWHRGRIMQTLTGRGGMAAVELSAADAAALAARFEGRLSVAAVNSPTSAVLSGDTDALQAALSELAARGVWQRQLPVNYAFHSDQVRPLCGDLLDVLEGLTPRPPTVSMVSTVTGGEASDMPLDARYWARNLTEPVRFADGIATLMASGHDLFVEIGPQPVLRKPITECLDTAGRTAAVLPSLRRGVDERAAILDTLASLYATGLTIDWRALYRGSPQLVDLPTYPWHRRRLWLDAEAAAAAAQRPHNRDRAYAAVDVVESPAEQHERMLQCLHELRWEPVERGRLAQADQPRSWLIFADAGGTAAAVADTLRARGDVCELILPSAVDPSSNTAFGALMRSLQAARGAFTGILYCRGLDARIGSEHSALRALLNIVQASGSAGWRARQLWIVTRGCQTATPIATADSLSQAPLWGMARSVPQEMPGLSCIAVDLDPDADARRDAEDLAGEIASWDGVDQLAFRGGRRYLPRIHQLARTPDAPSSTTPIVPDATYLITGGTGALGLELARWIVREGGRHLVLMSRSAPSPHVTSAADTLRASGADVRILQADVSQAADVARVLSEIDNTMPPLRGIVHAAGIVDVDFVERQSWERFSAVFPAKVDGAWHLHTATGSRPLDFFVLFSSTASVFGALGQANYSGANAFLDALAHYRRARGLTALTINWGPWGDIGMAARLGEQIRQRWALQGVSMLPPSDGLAAFSYLLGTDLPQAQAIAIDWQTFVANHPQIDRTTLFAAIAAGRERTDTGSATQFADLRRQLDEADANANAEEAARLVQELVQQQFADALGFESASALDPDLGFLEMGVDSLIATRVMLNLNEALRLRLPMSAMFEHRTISALTEEIMRVRASEAQAIAAGEATDAEQASRTQPTRIVHLDTNEPAPLSSAQEGLWFVSRFETDEPAYNEALVLRIDGEIDQALLGRVLDEIVRRHETLRTVFQEDEDGPVQIVRPPTPVDLPIEDCTGLRDAGPDALRARLTAEVRQPFSLDKGPLLRARLLQLGPTEHVLLLVTHHLVIDGWSYGVLAREFAALCETFRAGVPSPLPELVIQYRDFARWQRRRLWAGELDDQLSYWQREIAHVPVLDWPSVARTKRTFSGAMIPFVVSKADEQALAALGEREGATLFMTLLAVYVACLYRHTQQDDFAIGLPVGGRPRETEPLIGLLMNVLPMRARVNGRLTFRELLARVRQSALGAFSNQDLPFNYLVQQSDVARDPRWSPIFQVMFVLENAPFPDVALSGLHLSPIRVDFGVAKFDLTLMFEQREGRLDGFVEYNTALFDEAFVTTLIAHYQRLLAEVITNPDRRVAELPLLTDAERTQLVSDFNATTVLWDGEANATSLVAWVERQVQRTPNAIAMWTESSVWTYAALHAQANQLAHALRRRGVGAETRVAVWIEREAPLIVALLAVVKTGAAFVPLDPTYPTARLAGQLADARVTVVLTSRACVESVPAGEYAVEIVDAPEAAWRRESTAALRLGAPTHAACAAGAAPDGANNGETPIAAAASGSGGAAGQDAAARHGAAVGSGGVVAPEQLAYVIYTSGSTGQPKGAMNTQAGIANRLAWMQATYGLTANDRVLHKTSSSFDVAVWEVFWPLGTGATLVLARPGGHREPAYLADVIQRAGVTAMHFVPTMLEAFVASGGLDACEGVRLMVCSGEALPGPLATRCMQAWSGRLDNLYGPTEAAVDVTWQPCTPDATAGAVVPIGRPVANTQTYVIEASGTPAPVGVIGELYLGGVQLARGYWQDPARTAERFVPDGLSGQPGARLYRTGDLSRVRGDGVVEYLGRVDHQVKIRGHRVELGEIEAALRQQPEVRDAAVLLRSDDGPGESRLVAYVVATSAGLPPTETLRARLRQQLPEAMIPATVMVLDALPVTPNGKLDRRALPVPPAERPALAMAAVAPRTAVEQTLAEIWRQILRVEHVGVHDNFFALGGHSLLAVQLFTRVRKTFGLELQLSALLNEPTIAQMAQAIVEHQRAGALAEPEQSIVHEEAAGSAPLSPAQLRLWFVTRVETDEPVYNEALALDLTGPLHVSIWEAVFTEIVRRHETLRTVFSNSEDGPIQIVRPATAVLVPVDDLSHTPLSERDEALRHAIDTDVHAAFDLAHGPLWRARLIRFGPDSHVLILVMHHIITDGWSYNVLAHEASLLYAAFSHDRPSTLADLPIQYGDYARWQRRQLETPRLQAQLAYWQHALDGLGPLEWGAVAARRARQTFRGATHFFVVPPRVVEELRDLASNESATLFMTLLTGFFALLHRYTHQRDFVVGTPVAGRTLKETEPLIGLFVNLLAIRAGIDRRTTFRELLARVRHQSLAAFANQDVPFEVVVDRLAGRRNRRVPLVQAVFVLQNAPSSDQPLAQLQVEPINVERDTSKFDFMVMLEEIDGGLRGMVEYSTDLFDATLVETMIGHYQQLLDAATETPDERVAEMPLLDAAEREQILSTGTPEPQPWPQEITVADRVEDQAAATPDAIAVLCDGRAVTYAELHRRANQLAHVLREEGVGPEVRVAVCTGRGLDLIIAILAIWKAGGAYVPLDPHAPAARLAFMVRDVGAHVLLATTELGERLEQPDLRRVYVDSDRDRARIEAAPADRLNIRLTNLNLAYVIYTSGSTGQPKGVGVTHGNLAGLFAGTDAMYRFSPSDTWTLFHSEGFDFSVWEMWGALAYGGRLVIVPYDQARKPETFAAIVRDERVTVLNQTPSAFQAFQSVQSPEGLALRLVIFGGESLAFETLHDWVDGVAGRPQLVNGYGITETTVFATFYPLVPRDVKTSVASRIGWAIPNWTMYLLDEAQQPVPTGVTGEIYVGGTGIARGFLGRPDLTAERFVPDPFSDTPGARLYRSGDLARWSTEGVCEFLGRADHQVKLRGYRIEVGEIEAALREQPEVRDATVLLREDEPGVRRLVAYVVQTTAAADDVLPLTSDALQRRLRSQLPEYMIPAVIVTLDALPLTANGKVDRKALPVPSGERPAMSAPYEAPRTPLEATLAQIWADVLKVDRVGIHDNFFDLGGASLSALEIMARLADADVPLDALDPTQIFTLQTVADVAAAIASHDDEGELAPVIGERTSEQ